MPRLPDFRIRGVRVADIAAEHRGDGFDKDFLPLGFALVDVVFEHEIARRIEFEGGQRVFDL